MLISGAMCPGVSIFRQQPVVRAEQHHRLLSGLKGNVDADSGRFYIPFQSNTDGHESIASTINDGMLRKQD